MSIGVALASALATAFAGPIGRTPPPLPPRAPVRTPSPLPPRATVFAAGLFGRSSQKPSPPPPPAATQFAAARLPAYASLVALGALPAIEWDAELVKPLGLIYFFTLAIGTVYEGVQRQELGETAPITSKNAALAPLVAGSSLSILYALIKFTDVNPATVYQVASGLFAIVSWNELLTPLCGLALTRDAVDDDDEESIMKAGSLPATVLAIALAAAYAQGPSSTGGALPLPLFAALNNLLAWGIAMSALGVLALESFTAGAALLIGLFCYDAFFVFQSDVMLTVATTIEAPAKFLFVSANPDAVYPFSVLGLGDIVIPGAFVALMRQRDLDCNEAEGAEAAFPYYNSAVAAYGAGLGTTFLANFVTQSGQPALVYIVPSLLLAAFATAAARGELESLVSYKSVKAVEAAAEIAAARKKNNK